jgi:hypothetical protein
MVLTLAVVTSLPLAIPIEEAVPGPDMRSGPGMQHLDPPIAVKV